MLRGELTGLRAHTDADIEIFESELLTEVEARIRATGRPWLPVAPGAPDSPYRQAEDRNAVVRFSVIELATGDLAGEAVMAGIDLHNRRAEIGLVLRPAFREVGHLPDRRGRPGRSGRRGVPAAGPAAGAG